MRPNTGVIKPKSTCDFTVTMQAQKFLVQSTAVPPGTTEEDITSNIFSKEGGKYSEEKKLKVVLISPPHSSFLLPSSGELKKDCPGGLYSTKFQIAFSLLQAEIDRYLNNQRYYYRQTLRVIWNFFF